MIQYILKALLEDNSIFVNDLGTFTKTYQPARFDGDTLLPPQYSVTLTVKDDQPDDTGFINLLCREKQCRITEAAAEISRWVGELKTALENNKSVSFANFGTFSLNNRGDIQFVSDHIDDLNREFEGMGVVKLGEIGEEAEEQERLAKEAEERRLQEEAEQRLKEAEEQERLAKEAEERRLQEEAEQRLREEKETVQEVKEDEGVEESETKEEVPEVKEAGGGKKRRGLWWLFVLIILIAAGVLGYLFRQQLTDAFNWIKEKVTAPKEAVVEEESVTIAEDTVAYEEAAIEEDTLAEPEVHTPEVVRNTANGNYPVIRFEPGHYYVIAGSLPNEQDAVRHIKQRNLDQYEPKIVLQNGVPNLRVCIGIYDTEEEAESFAKSLNPKYWVLK